MSKIGLVILLILMAGRNYAQQNYFVLIQADNNQPFYVRLENKSISSSAQGHLILSQLKEGTYTITIGFPKKLFPEQQFSISLLKKDLEFQLKDLGEKGWGLFNPQTLELKMPEEKKEDQLPHHLEGVKKDDAFSRLMAGVVSDTAVMYNTYALEATLRDSPAVSKAVVADTASSFPQGIAATGASSAAGAADTPGTSGIPASGTPATAGISASGLPVGTSSDSGAAPAAVKDTSALAVNGASGAGTLKTATRLDTAYYETPLFSRDSARLNPTKKDSSAFTLADSAVSVPPATPGSAAAASKPASASPLYRPGPVVKLSERKTSKGLRLVYADRQKGQKADTIVVIIPLDTTARLTQRTTATGSSVSSPAGSDTSTTTGAYRPITSPNGSEITTAKTSPAANSLFRSDTSQKKTPARLPFINSDCRNFATDYDVDRLRVKMLESAKEEDRILVARKIFKTKCFTTRQIKALCEVFASDGQKFKFLETAYPFVSDEHFKELADLLADPVYNSKFKTMTGQ